MSEDTSSKKYEMPTRQEWYDIYHSFLQRNTVFDRAGVASIHQRPVERAALLELSGKVPNLSHMFPVVSLDTQEWLAQVKPPDSWRECPACGNLYPRTSQYWSKNRDGSDGLYSLCRKCKNNAQVRRRRAGRYNYSDKME